VFYFRAVLTLSDVSAEHNAFISYVKELSKEQTSKIKHQALSCLAQNPVSLSPSLSLYA
jgi:hypothetical protein